MVTAPCACHPGRPCLAHYAALPISEKRVIRTDLGLSLPFSVRQMEEHLMRGSGQQRTEPGTRDYPAGYRRGEHRSGRTERSLWKERA